MFSRCLMWYLFDENPLERKGLYYTSLIFTFQKLCASEPSWLSIFLAFIADPQKGKINSACWLTVLKSRQTRLSSVWVLAASKPAKGCIFELISRQT
jgi:hypothetical protein